MRRSHRCRRPWSLQSVVRPLAGLVVAGLAAGGLVHAQQPLLDRAERDRAKQMLGDIESAIKDNYYDKAYRGIDLKAHFGDARQKLETAVSVGHAYAIIAQALMDFDDSHTFFIPPMRAATYDYGWQMQIVGNDCFVVAVKPGSDAAAKGLKPGDRILKFDAFMPTRRDLWKARYLYQTLSPRNTLNVVVQSPGGSPRPLALDAKVTPRKKVIEIGIENILEGSQFIDEEEEAMDRGHRVARLGEIAIWKLSSFNFESQEVEKLVNEIVKGATSLVIDVRGNGGGSVKTLEEITRRLFDREVKIADLKGRRSMKPSIAKKRSAGFSGKTVVLIDAESASAAEVLARVIQLEQRGTVIGDRSSGSVMQSRQRMAGVDTVDGFIPYAVSITDADLIMTDGKSLEHVGVTPDELLIPTPADLAAGRDPVLARAVTLLGATLDPVQAGRMFPVVWKEK